MMILDGIATNCGSCLKRGNMDLEEALLIARRMEEDQVCGPVGLALRIVYAELLSTQSECARIDDYCRDLEQQVINLGG